MNTDQQVNLPIPIIDDGFGDSADSDRIIQGSIVRCVDGHWSDRDGISFPPAGAGHSDGLAALEGPGADRNDC